MSAVWDAVFLILGFGGLVGSYFVWRRKGAMRGLRAVAWSLIPLGAVMTHTASFLGRIGSAIADFAAKFVLSPTTYVGLVVLGVAVVLFLTTGGLPVLRWDRRRRQRKNGQADAAGGRQAAPPAQAGAQPKAVAAPKKRTAATAGGDDDFSEVEAILRRRGIK